MIGDARRQTGVGLENGEENIVIYVVVYIQLLRLRGGLETTILYSD